MSITRGDQGELFGSESSVGDSLSAAALSNEAPSRAEGPTDPSCPTKATCTAEALLLGEVTL